VRRYATVLTILAVQAVCTVFFVSDILLTVLGTRTAPISWQSRELLEIGASVGLILGVVLGALALRRSIRERHRAEEKLRRASGAFLELLTERFDDWGLTPAERDVALFAIKGLSTQEIAALRATSEGTVKAQTNAIYRKAGVSGRPQLLSLFIEDLMDGERHPARALDRTPDRAPDLSPDLAPDLARDDASGGPRPG
jgi:DNA-binding CsgD family transcriptional regulator